MAQEHDMVPGKVAFLGIQLQARQLDPRKDFIQVKEMVCECTAVNQYIIQIYHTNVPWQAPQNELHHALKRGWRIGQTHRHSPPLIQAPAGRESCLLTILLSHFYLPVAIRKVKCAEPGRAS